jgi:hypothetical protein
MINNVSKSAAGEHDDFVIEAILVGWWAAGG